jgi:hypothetical protein
MGLVGKRGSYRISEIGANPIDPSQQFEITQDFAIFAA